MQLVQKYVKQTDIIFKMQLRKLCFTHVPPSANAANKNILPFCDSVAFMLGSFPIIYAVSDCLLLILIFHRISGLKLKRNLHLRRIFFRLFLSS